MKDSVWILIALSAVNTIANALERPIWTPECLSNDNAPTDILLPHPSDCAKFYKCVNGLAYPATCPVGLHWSQSLSQCDYPDLANCQIIQTRSVQAIQDPLCPIDENPLNPTHLPNEIDCEQFYECLGGYAYAMACPGGLHWSVELNRCEHPDVANCQRKESRALTGDGYLNADCPLFDDPNDPMLLPYSRDCGKFLKCSFGRSYILSCPYGLHWDIKSNRCESPFVAKCNSGGGSTPSITESSEITRTTPTTKETTTRTTPTTKETTTRTIPTTTETTKITTTEPDPNLPVPMPQCSDPNSVQKFKIPGECKVFLQCFHGLGYRIQCREGREWSVAVNDCIDAALARCSATSGSDGGSSTTKSTSSTTTTTARTTTKVPTSCTEGVEYISHPTDCNKFIQCDNGNPIEKDCPSPLYWSKTFKNCQWTADDCR